MTTTLTETKNQNMGALQTPAVRYCLYARKSTESDEKQALSIDSQIKEMLEIARRNGLEVSDIRKESHSAKESGTRPIFNQLIEDIKEGKFNGILAWAPDRLSRNAGDLGKIVDLMDKNILLEIRTYGQKFRDSPSEKFMLMIMGSQAKLENDNKSLNVKRGLRARAERGLWLAVAPIGYLNEKRSDRKGYLLVDPKRAPAVKEMFEKVAYEKWSGRRIYQWLIEIDFKTRNGKHLSLSIINAALRNSFYYGVFEYPRGSGNFYTGKYKPLIDKKLFEQAQKVIDDRKREIKVRGKEFAFTRLFKCGLCGSGIAADEKFKKQKNGNIHHYIYYGCTKSRDKNCKCGYIREKDLIEQLLNIIDEVSLDRLGMKERIGKEVERYRNFRCGVLGIKEGEELKKKINARAYAKYLLKEGSIGEKRELLSNLKSKLILKNKKVYLEK